MPHPNRPQSSPNLRPFTSQWLDTCSSLNSKSMPTSDPLLPNATIRRLSSSRRARPTATSLADIFVRSLVLASYCNEHSPRGRGMTTMSINNLNGNGVKGEARSVARTTKQLPSNTRLDYIRSQAECVGIYRPAAQRMFNSSVARRIDDYDREEVRLVHTSPEKLSHPMRNQHVPPDYAGRFKENFRPLPHRKLEPDGGIGSFFSSSATQDHRPSTDPMEKHNSKHRERKVGDRERYRHYISPQAKLYNYTSKLYKSALGESLDWKEAVDAIGKPPRPFKQIDTTQSAIELHSVQRFLEAMWDKSKSNHYVFTLYRELPHPGISCLSKRTRGALLRRFAHPRDRRWVDARRYLALVEDALTAGLPISRSLWTTAIHLAGRATGKVLKHDLVRAIGIWQQMEHIAGIKSDNVVFGVLFDIAIKSGQFTVADRLLDEMEKRNIQFGRTGKVSQMYYYGLRQDPEGIRRTFNEFVAGGDIVDTAVLNCLMVSFLRAGETKMAEQLYQGIVQTQTTPKESTVSKSEPRHLYGVPGLTSELTIYRKRSRKLNRVLQLSASLKDILPKHHQALQDAFHMKPDTRTFHIFLSYHAYHSGNLDAFSSVLTDMERIFAAPPRGMIYVLLFEGFAHNGRRKKGWTVEKLRTVWKTYLRALYESKTRLNNRSGTHNETPIWENPLGTSPAIGPAKPLSQRSISSGLYTPLPSTITDVKDELDRKNPVDDDDAGAFPDVDADIDMEGLFDQRKQDHQPGPDELEAMERRIDNGVFLGRRMIKIILRAFGACCGPEEVMEVWLRLESIWQPEKRKGLDVLAVKEELEKQMNRVK